MSAGPETPLTVHVDATETQVAEGLNTKLRQAGLEVAPEAEPPPDTVIVSAAGTVEEAVDMCGDADGSSPASRLLVVDSFGRPGMLRAVQAGVRVMLRTSEADPGHLATAVRSAHHGDCSLPHEALLRLLTEEAPGETGPGEPPVVPVLTPRQIEMLTLVAEGYDNAAIAAALNVSEHTVKNVIYDLMSRMQVHNRTHAAARAVRTGLI